MAWFRALILFGMAAPVGWADDVRARDERVLRDAEVPSHSSALLAWLRERTPSESQRRDIEANIAQLARTEFRLRNQAIQRIKSTGVRAVGLLRRALLDVDPEVARRANECLVALGPQPPEYAVAAAIRTLGRQKAAGCLPVLLAYVPCADDEAVAEAIRGALASVALVDGKPDPAMVAATNSSEPSLRASAGDALIRVGLSPASPEIKALVRDASLDVRTRVNLALITSGREPPAVSRLIADFSGASPPLIWQAEDVLLKLAGDSAPPVTLAGDDTAREIARKAWAKWWAENGDRVSLTVLDERPLLLGYTLIAQMNANGADGRVVEYAPDGKSIRWQITGLQYPVDTQVLPREQRVLIAEFNSHAVTERDFEGRVHRRIQVTEPVACQRLPDGSTFVAYRNGLAEYNTANERILHFYRGLGDIVTGQKARDGTMVFVTRAGECIRVNRHGKVLRSFTVAKPYHFSSIELLPNHRVLVAHLNGVAEYDLATGRMEWEAQARTPVSATRLPDGKTLVASSLYRNVILVDSSGEQISEFLLRDAAVPTRAKRR